MTPTVLKLQRGWLLTTDFLVSQGVCSMLSQLRATIEILWSKSRAIIIGFGCETNNLKHCLSQSEAVNWNHPPPPSSMFTNRCCKLWPVLIPVANNRTSSYFPPRVNKIIPCGYHCYIITLLKNDSWCRQIFSKCRYSKSAHFVIFFQRSFFPCQA